ncbi:MAG: MATE family efflux transporter [Lachnospiraceae bacterium]|nr:MATE family efflux transporter [Lachnospiraceae bacterium]
MAIKALHKNKSDTTTDLTRGPILSKLLLFAIPLLGTSLIQQLYNTVDIMFVGNILGKDASAAVGTCGWPINCLVGFFTGMGVGVGILVSQSFGADDLKDVRRVIHNAMGLVASGSIFLMILGMIFTPLILRLMNTPEEILGMAVTYSRIYFLSMFSILGYNFSSGILRALGDSKSPMIYQLLGGIANIFGNTLFIYILKLGVAGAALSTFLSMTVAALLTIRHLMKLPTEYRYHIKDTTLELSVITRIIKIGVPMGVQTTLISVSLLLLQSGINTMGVASMAAYTSYGKLESMIYFPMWAVAQAVTTFVGQNLGSGQMDRVKKGTLIGLIIAITITLFIGFSITAFSRQFIRLFSNDKEVIELGSHIVRNLFPLYFIYAIVEVMSATMRGAGKSGQVMVVTTLNMFGVRIVALYVAMKLFTTVYDVCLIFPFTWITTTTSILILYFTGGWKKGWENGEKVS